jgi:glutamyl-tRNA reductase
MAQSIALIGTSHHVAPLEERERLAIHDGDEPAAVNALLALPGVEEAVVVSTCNRVEIVVAGAESPALVSATQRFLKERFALNDAWLDRFMYHKREVDAVQHLFRVTSSLDSLVIGEPQILGQVKRAFAASGQVGGTGPLLNKTFHQAFRVAKRVRTETKVAENAVSVSYAAVELGKKVFGSLEGRKILVIGAGKMGGLALQNLVAAGAREVHVINRTEARAHQLAARYGGFAHGFDKLPELLGQVDIVISSTGSQHYVVKHDTVRDALARRKYRPLLLIDIAVPRDIDPRCESLTNVYVYDVDDLQKVVEANMASRRGEASRAEGIILAEANDFQKKLAEVSVVPTIVGLRERLTSMRDAELERIRRAEPQLDDAAIQALQRYGHALVNKILHDPTVALRESAQVGQQAAMAAAIRRLFALGDDDGTPRGQDNGSAV